MYSIKRTVRSMSKDGHSEGDEKAICLAVEKVTHEVRVIAIINNINAVAFGMVWVSGRTIVCNLHFLMVGMC